MGLGAGEYVTELLFWMSKNVNSGELSCPPNWLEELIKAIPKDYPIARIIATMIQYSGDGKIIHQRPVPDSCRYISIPEMTALGNNTGVLKMIEDFFVYNRTHIETEIARRIGVNQARDWILHLELNVGRMSLTKALTGKFHTTTVGKISADKLEKMRKDWLAWVVQSVGENLVGLPERVGISIEYSSDGKKM